MKVGSDEYKVIVRKEEFRVWILFNKKEWLAQSIETVGFAKRICELHAYLRRQEVLNQEALHRLENDTE